MGGQILLSTFLMYLTSWFVSSRSSRHSTRETVCSVLFRRLFQRLTLSFDSALRLCVPSCSRYPLLLVASNGQLLLSTPFFFSVPPTSYSLPLWIQQTMLSSPVLARSIPMLSKSSFDIPRLTPLSKNCKSRGVRSAMYPQLITPKRGETAPFSPSLQRTIGWVPLGLAVCGPVRLMNVSSTLYCTSTLMTYVSPPFTYSYRRFAVFEPFHSSVSPYSDSISHFP
jgi:hypothetical protein